MAALVRPQVPGVTSIGNVIAQAQQAAATQSAHMLTAANNIARDRQRAGERAADAVVRMRLEAFQREQFEHKKEIADARLAIAQAEEGRAADRHPLAMRAAQNELDLHPYRIRALEQKESLYPFETRAAGVKAAMDEYALNEVAARSTTLPQRMKQEEQMAEIELGLGQRKLDALTREEDILKQAESLTNRMIDIFQNDPSPETINAFSDQLQVSPYATGDIINRFNSMVDHLEDNDHSGYYRNIGLNRVEYNPIPIPSTPDGYSVSGIQVSQTADGRNLYQYQIAPSSEFNALTPSERRLEFNNNMSQIDDTMGRQVDRLKAKLNSYEDRRKELNTILSKATVGSEQHEKAKEELATLSGKDGKPGSIDAVREELDEAYNNWDTFSKKLRDDYRRAGMNIDAVDRALDSNPLFNNTGNPYDNMGDPGSPLSGILDRAAKVE